MDSYQELFEKGHYDTLIKLLKDETGPKARLYLSLAYSAKGEFKEALPVLLKDKKAIYNEHPVEFIKALLQLRIALGQFDEAYEDVEWLNNQPYISQEVEEELRGLKDAIRAAEISSFKNISYSEEEIRRILTSPKDPFELLSLLSQLGKFGVGPYIKELISICSSNHPHDCRVYALLLLVAYNYGGPVDFVLSKEKQTLVPSKLIPPFTNEAYLSTKALLDTYKDPSLGKLALDLLDEAIISCYPTPLPEQSKENETAAALLTMANEYLGLPKDSNIFTLLNTQKEDAIKIKEKLEELLTPRDA